jgi:hypothetical protein
MYKSLSHHSPSLGLSLEWMRSFFQWGLPVCFDQGCLTYHVVVASVTHEGYSCRLFPTSLCTSMSIVSQWLFSSTFTSFKIPDGLLFFGKQSVLCYTDFSYTESHRESFYSGILPQKLNSTLDCFLIWKILLANRTPFYSMQRNVNIQAMTKDKNLS